MDDLSAPDRAAFQTALTAAIRGDVRFDRFSRATHATDASVYQIFPLGVVAPRTTGDVIAAVNLCREHGVSITARGGGTSQAGQAVGAGISLDFSRHMNRILDLDLAARTVWVEPGLVLDELNDQLRPHGLQLPLDLSTSSRATIGGMVANNSAGTRSVIYGKTIDYVEGLRVVLADGTVAEMETLRPTEWSLKAAQPGLEGGAYRVVQHLAAEHQDEIRRRYPRIQRRVGGYNLDEFLPDKRPFNLARIMVGSEGTLGMSVAAKLRLVPLVKHRIVCSVQFPDLLEAMRATPAILEHGPSAVELVDRFLLDMTKGRIEFEPLRDFIDGDPGAVLIVEFMGDDPDALPGCLDAMQADLQQRGLGNHFHRAIAPAAQARIWQLRQAALGLTMSATGDPKAISFVEDTAVAPENLRDYIENFQTILARHNTQAGFYAHASVGLLHIRPVVDMKTAAGVATFEAIANEVADLVLEYGGALSGEHGDGLVRAPFQEKMFGPTLYAAFCQVKAAFDPTGLFNPGKIVHAPALTANLRFGPDYETPQLPTAFDFSDFGGILRAAEQCSGVGACRKTLSGTMCPSYMATRNETDSTRGRANALRVALTHGLGSGGLADDELRPVLDLCLECKACKRECPTGVDMARLKSEFLHQHHQVHGPSLRERLLSRADLIGAWGSRFAPFSNWLLGNSFTRQINEKLFGLDRRRPLPTFAQRPFAAHFRPSSTANTGPTVALFADTFNNYYEPAHLHAAAGLLAAAGAQVIVPPKVCCGRPLISKGFLDQAQRQAEQSVRALLPLAQAGIPILFVEPGCHSAVIDDHPHLLRGQAAQDAQTVAEASHLVDHWLSRQKMDFAPGPKQILLHGHCHQKALVGMDATLALLSRIPGCQVTLLDSGCCGMAGSFGYEQYDVSQAVGERRLFPAVRETDAETVVVAPGYSCRQQIHHFTGVAAHSPVSLLRTHLSMNTDSKIERE